MIRIGVTAGCPAGVGPEVTAAAMLAADLDDNQVRCVFLGPASVLLRGAVVAGLHGEREAGSHTRVVLEREGRSRVIECEEHDDLRLDNVTYGHPDKAALRFQKAALLVAAEAASAGRVHAIVTGPIRKKALVDVSGRAFPGQTELLHHYLARDDRAPLMCFAGGPFVLGLATVHVPLQDVTAGITKERLELCLDRLSHAARRVMGVMTPRLCVLGVNPHAGEGGLLGTEERDVVSPVLEAARGRGTLVEGPLPADGFFAGVHRRTADTMPHGVLAMYHDQGLAPYKLLAKGHGVNLTWGLTVPRTSPDHGTADDIAGQGVADPSSTTAALELAAKLALRP